MYKFSAVLIVFMLFTSCVEDTQYIKGYGPGINLPSAFTPNDDGKNDTWNLDFSRYSDSKLLVFSKWGREVFGTADKVVHWDGTSPGGAKLPNGVYYYTLELNGGEISQSGYITLLR